MKQFFYFFLLLFFVFTLNALRFPLSVCAQTPIQSGQTPTPAVAPSINYTMPFTGLLPDNPLYMVKVLRDRIVGFLISDPLKHAQFDLLQSDKRIGGAYGLQLTSSNKQQLIGDTVSKADNYFAEGIEQLHLSKKQGLDITDETNQFFLSNQKHIEIILQMEKISGPVLKPLLKKEEARMGAFAEEVDKDAPQK